MVIVSILIGDLVPVRMSSGPFQAAHPFGQACHRVCQRVHSLDQRQQPLDQDEQLLGLALHGQFSELLTVSGYHDVIT